MQDASRKDRTTRGERSASAKLTEADVREVRRRHAEGDVPHSKLASAFGVHERTVKDIIQRKRWAHLSD